MRYRNPNSANRLSAISDKSESPGSPPTFRNGLPNIPPTAGGVLCDRRVTSATLSRRLAYIDWVRGLACLLVFQNPQLRLLAGSRLTPEQVLHVPQLRGTFRAPLFLFLAGISFALVTEKLWKKNLPPVQMCSCHHPPRHRDLRVQRAIPSPGILHCLGLGAVERSVTRGSAQYNRGASGQVARIFYGTT